MIKQALIKIIKLIKPIIRFIAYYSDLKLNYPWTGLGEHPLIIEDNEDDYKRNIPKSVFFNTRSGKIVVGKNTVFGEDVFVLTGKHKYLSELNNIENLHTVPDNGRDIIIGSNCYIGSGAILIGPIKIGDFSVICAGAVVTKNVDSYAMWGGEPARLIKNLSQNE